MTLDFMSMMAIHIVGMSVGVAFVLQVCLSHSLLLSLGL